MQVVTNKYLEGYWFLCNKAKNRILSKEIVVEKHHVMPKSIYGKNKNLVQLTPREHYLAHKMLWQGLKIKYGTKDIRTRKMACAFHSMRMSKNKKLSSADYELLKIALSETHKNKTISLETKKKMSIAKSGIYNGSNNPMYGKSAFDIWLYKYGEEEANIRQREANKKNSKSLTGHKSWNHQEGINKTEEHKKKISAALLGKQKSDEHKSKLKKPKSEQAKLNMKLAQQKRRQKELKIKQ